MRIFRCCVSRDEDMYAEGGRDAAAGLWDCIVKDICRPRVRGGWLESSQFRHLSNAPLPLRSYYS